MQAETASRPGVYAATREFDECSGLSERILEDARQALTFWATVYYAVGGQTSRQINPEYWGRVIDLLLPVLNEDPHFFENSSICSVAAASARLLIKPWTHIKKMDKWLNPAWLVRYLSWEKILVQGWGAFFAVLRRQISYRPRNKTIDYGPQVGLPLYPEAFGPRSLAHQAQVTMEGWLSTVCYGCWIDEVFYVGQTHRVWSFLWDLAQSFHELGQRKSFPRTFFLRPGVSRMGINIFPAKQGLRCSVAGPDYQIRCADFFLSVTSPFENDFSAPVFDAGLANMAPTAVCITGPLRASQQTAGLVSIRQHLVEPLQADAFAYVPVRSYLDAQDVASAIASALGDIRTLVIVEEYVHAELAVAIGAETIEERYLLYEGNWRAPLFEESGGNLLMLFQQAACWEMVKSFEKQRGAQYGYVVWSRIDFFWMASHPPIHKSGLTDSLSVWIPRNEDWWGGGINDRHAALTRKVSEVYLTRWHGVVDGSAVSLLDAPIKKVRSSGEQMLRRLLEATKVDLWRFSPVSFVSCCAPSQDCHHEQGDDRPHTKLIRPRCAKYPSESRTVLNTIASFQSYEFLPKDRWASSDWIWIPPRVPPNRDAINIWDGVLFGFGQWHLGCCFGPSGPVSCWAWIWLRRCITLPSARHRRVEQDVRNGFGTKKGWSELSLRYSEEFWKNSAAPTPGRQR